MLVIIKDAIVFNITGFLICYMALKGKKVKKSGIRVTRYDDNNVKKIYRRIA